MHKGNGRNHPEYIPLFGMWAKIRTIKFQHRRNYTNAKNQMREGDWMKKKFDSKKCVECGDHVPTYQNYLCEKCWAEALNVKLEAEDEATTKK